MHKPTGYQELNLGSLGCIRTRLAHALEVVIRLEERALADPAFRGRAIELIDDFRRDMEAVGRRMGDVLRDAPRLPLSPRGENFRVIGGFDRSEGR